MLSLFKTVSSVSSADVSCLWSAAVIFFPPAEHKRCFTNLAWGFIIPFQRLSSVSHAARLLDDEIWVYTMQSEWSLDGKRTLSACIIWWMIDGRMKISQVKHECDVITIQSLLKRCRREHNDYFLHLPLRVLVSFRDTPLIKHLSPH